jgi:spore germination protein KA
MGETAVNAKLIHPVSLIIVGITLLSSFLSAIRGVAAEDVLLSQIRCRECGYITNATSINE